MVTASEAREPDGYRDCSNRLLGGWRTYDAEAALPHSDPQLRTRETVLGVAGCHGGGALGVSQWVRRRARSYLALED